MNKRVEVASVNSRTFIEKVIELAKKGATLPENVAVLKGIMLRVQLEVPEDVVIEPHPAIRVLPVSKKERDEYAKEQGKKHVIPAKETEPQKEEAPVEEIKEEEKPSEEEAKPKRGRKPATE